MTMKISIITPCLNNRATLEDTCRSVLNQTYKDIEHIVVDGGSEDGTQEMLRSLETTFNGKLHWISEPDNGLYDAINKGIENATGDIVGILNSDDYYTSDDVLQQVADELRNPNIAAVYGDIHFVRPTALDKCVRYYSSKHFHPRWLRFGFMPAHPSFYVRRHIQQQVGAYKTDYKIGSDYEMMVRLFRVHGIKAKYISKDFVTMRTGGVSTRNLNSRLTLLHENVRACRENGIYTNLVFVSLKFLYKIFELRTV